MADPLSVAGSVIGIAAAGVKVSISLFALAETVSTASQRVESIANDITSTCGILNQLRDLIDPKQLPDGTWTSIFNSTALRDISSALHHCRSIFTQVNAYLKRASRQIKRIDTDPIPNDKKLKLSRTEKAKWPFLQPQFDDLRNDLRDSKSNLLLMVAVANLAVANKRGRASRIVDEDERMEMRATIVKLQRAGTAEVRSMEEIEEDEGRFKRFFKRLATFGSRGKEVTSEVESEDEERSPHVSPAPQPSSRSRPVQRESVDQSVPAVESDGGNPMTDNQGTSIPEALPAVPPQGHPEPLVSADATENGLHKDDELPVVAIIVSNASDKLSGEVEAEVEQSPNSDAEKRSVQEDTHPNVAHQATNTDLVLGIDAAVQTVAVDTIFQTAMQDLPSNRAGMSPSEQADNWGAWLNTKKSKKKKVHKALSDTKDAAVQTTVIDLTPPENSQDRPPTPNSPGIGPSRVSEPDHRGVQFGPDKGKQRRKRYTSTHSDADDDADEAENIGLVDDTLDNPQLLKKRLRAWTMGILPGLSLGIGNSITAQEIATPADVLDRLLGGEVDLFDMLNKLNAFQTQCVLSHVGTIKSKLVYVEIWKRQSVPTVFGELELAILIWVTESPKATDRYRSSSAYNRGPINPVPPHRPVSIFGNVSSDDDFPYSQPIVTQQSANREWRPPRRRTSITSDDWDVISDAKTRQRRNSVRRRRSEVIEARPVRLRDDEFQAAQKEAEAKGRKEAELEAKKALAEAKAAAEGLQKAKKAAEEEAAKLNGGSDMNKEPIKFKDAVGRKFSFPWHIAKNWHGMEELIKQAFLHVDVIGPHVNAGHYDLVGPSGEIVLPQIWEYMVQPGWNVIMHMWPMPEPPPLPPAPNFSTSGPPPPPPGADLPMMMMPMTPMPPAKAKRPKKQKSSNAQAAYPIGPSGPPPPPLPLPIIEPLSIPPSPPHFGSDTTSYLSRRRRGKKFNITPSALMWMAGSGVPKPKLRNPFKPQVAFDRLTDEDYEDAVVKELFSKWIENDNEDNSKSKKKKTKVKGKGKEKAVDGGEGSGGMSTEPQLALT